MYFRPHWAIYSSTYPCVWAICLSWWCSTLLLENYPYDFIHYQKICTIVLILIQCGFSIVKRRNQYKREYLIVHNQTPKCNCYILLLDLVQMILVFSWFIFFASILVISPWVSNYQATICLLCFIGVIFGNLTDYAIYNKILLSYSTVQCEVV